MPSMLLREPLSLHELDAAEKRDVELRLDALRMFDNARFGVSIHQFGNATAFALREWKFPLYNRVMSLGSEDGAQLPEILRFYRDLEITPRLEIIDEQIDHAFEDVLQSNGFKRSGRVPLLYLPTVGAPATTPRANSEYRIEKTSDHRIFVETLLRSLGIGSDRWDWAFERFDVMMAHGPRIFFVARAGDLTIGAGSLIASGDVFTVTSAATTSEARGRGVHRALIDARVEYGAGVSATAVLVSQPDYGSQSHRNLVSRGFIEAATKSIWTAE